MDADTNHLIPMRQGGFFDGPTHSLRGEGLDASEDGTGRGTPLVAIPIQNALRGKSQNGLGVAEDGSPMFTLDQGSQHGVAVGPVPFDTTQITSKTNRCQPKAGDPCHPLAAGAHPPAIAFSCKDSGADAGEISPTLRAMGHAGSHQNAGGQVAVAFHQNGSGELRTDDKAYTLNTNGNASGRNAPLVKTHMSVRRLTPLECARLQGFPDRWCEIPYGPKGRPAPDGPQYKAYGNSMAVPVMRSIGRSIAAVHAKYAPEIVEV